jgi:hypothetical protein
MICGRGQSRNEVIEVRTRRVEEERGVGRKYFSSWNVTLNVKVFIIIQFSSFIYVLDKVR